MNSLLTSDYDYDLPEDLIAKKPASKRDHSKLFVLDRKTATFTHKIFYQIVDYLSPNDLLVLNNTKVIESRIFGEKETGGKVEILLLKKIEEKIWQATVSPSKRIRKGSKIIIGESYAVVEEDLEQNIKQLRFFCEDDFSLFLKKYGNTPLPPYIASRLSDEEKKDPNILQRYQTIYASKEGAAAAPTAGLHFTKEIFEKLRHKGIEITYITLHTGIGTFKPVKVEKITDHKMAEEEYEINPETAQKILKAKENGKRIVAVGTTVTRCLEDCFAKNNKIVSTKDEAKIFIYPPFEFRVVDALITNFHFPKSTLLMLVSAFAGRELILNAYREAIEKKYRFYSFGDAMLIV